MYFVRKKLLELQDNSKI